MNALTLYQPWASLIAEGPKTVETRDRIAPPEIIGHRLAIHAASRRVRITERNDPLLYRDIRRLHGAGWQENLPTKAVVATALLAGCFTITGWRPDGRPELAGIGQGADSVALDNMGDFRRGKWLWVLRDIRRLNPGPPGHPAPQAASPRQRAAGGVELEATRGE